MSEKNANHLQEFLKEAKIIKDRNDGIVKAYNNGLSEEEILEQFEINKEALASLLKSAKRNGLLKSPVMEEKKPRRGRPPLKPQEETKPLLKETDLKKKPKPVKKPKQDAIDENLEKVSDDTKKAIESFAPEKKETIGESSAKAIGIAQKELTKLGEGLAKALSHNATELSKSLVPKMDIPKLSPEKLSEGTEGPADLFPNAEESFKEVRKEMKRELFGKLVPADDEKLFVELKAIENYEQKALQDELKYMAAVMEEKDLEIAKLKEQVKRFDFLETLAIELMRNTIALVDQAEEQRLEGRQ